MWRIQFCTVNYIVFSKSYFCALFALILKFSERRSFCAHPWMQWAPLTSRSWNWEWLSERRSLTKGLIRRHKGKRMSQSRFFKDLRFTLTKTKAKRQKSIKISRESNSQDSCRDFCFQEIGISHSSVTWLRIVEVFIPETFLHQNILG